MLSNKNCFRELADKSNIAVSWSDTLIARCLQCTAEYARDKIKWTNACDKRGSSDAYEETSRLQNIIGCIDGCHIRIKKPVKRGQDYMNHMDYYSVMFIGIIGRVHDVRVCDYHRYMILEKTELLLLQSDMDWYEHGIVLCRQKLCVCLLSSILLYLSCNKNQVYSNRSPKKKEQSSISVWLTLGHGRNVGFHHYMEWEFA